LGALTAVAVVLVIVAPCAPRADPEREAAARCASGFRLTAGKRVSGHLSQGGVHVYRIARERGEVLDAVVEQISIDAAVALRAPSGRSLLEVNSPNGNRGPEPAFAVAEARQEYCLEVRAGEDHGDYTVRVDPSRQASAADRARADAVSAFSRAEQLRKNHEFKRAIPEYQRTLDLWTAIGDRFQQGITLYRLGWTHQDRGHAAEAIDPFLRALPRLEGHPVETVAVLIRLGSAYQDRGQTGIAFGIYQKALAISQKVGDFSGQAGVLNRRGQIYANWGEFESARGDYESSLELWRQMGSAEYEADLLGNLAELDLVVGRLEDARDASSKALAIHQERRDQGGEINSLRKLGEALTQLDKPKPALQVLERSVDLARKIGNKRYWLWSLEALGVALLREKSLDRASTVYDQARDLSLELQSPHDTAEVVSDLAEIAELRGDRPAALAGFEQARAMYERLGEPAAVAWTLASRASAYQAADSLPEARADLEAALAIVENLRVKPRASASRASFLASRHGYYETYIDVLMRLGRRRSDKAYEQLAFEASERARARALLDDLGRSGTLLLSGVDGKLQ
jgi:tetratricopeptide (TPR) repeat protein